MAYDSGITHEAPIPVYLPMPPMSDVELFALSKFDDRGGGRMVSFGRGAAY